VTASDENFTKVVGQLSRVSRPARTRAPIRPETEIYYDLGLYGDDLFELFRWLRQEFGVEVHVRLSKYAPSETPWLALPKAFSRLMGQNASRYASLTVGDIVAAIERGRWADD